EIGQTRRADRLEATLGNRHACDRPSRDRLSNTLDLVPAKVAEAEQIAEQPTRGAGDHNRPRLAQRLEAGCYVGRVPDQSTFPQRTPATEVPDHHQTSRDANANRERFRGSRLQL